LLSNFARHLLCLFLKIFLMNDSLLSWTTIGMWNLQLELIWSNLLPQGNQWSTNSTLEDLLSMLTFVYNKQCHFKVTTRQWPTRSSRHGQNWVQTTTLWRENIAGCGFKLDFIHYSTRITSAIRAKIHYKFHLLHCREWTNYWKGIIIFTLLIVLHIGLPLLSFYWQFLN